MFPIRDSRGRVLAFGGRVIDQGEPKYLNSPETPLFHKGRELYGLYEARQARNDFKRLMVVEGYMDVVRLHQAGITYAVATLGTATTQEHLNKIFRLTSELVFCFDGDGAGRAGGVARARERAAPGARRAASSNSCSCPRAMTPTRWWRPRARRASRRRLKSSAAAVRIPGAAARLAGATCARRRPGQARRAGGAIVLPHARGRVSGPDPGEARGGDAHAGCEAAGASGSAVSRAGTARPAGPEAGGAPRDSGRAEPTRPAAVG